MNSGSVGIRGGKQEREVEYVGGSYLLGSVSDYRVSLESGGGKKVEGKDRERTATLGTIRRGEMKKSGAPNREEVVSSANLLCIRKARCWPNRGNRADGNVQGTTIGGLVSC